MPFNLWVLPNGKDADREHVQAYANADAAKEDREHLARLLPATDTITGDWRIVAEGQKKFDFSRCRESPNVPGAGVDAESVTPRAGGPVTISVEEWCESFVDGAIRDFWERGTVPIISPMGVG
jgi:hypothetical protein